MVSDFELLDRWAAGDDAAARELVERHFDALFRFLRSKVSGDVEDLVQDTLLSCVRSRDRYRRESSFRTFLLGTARNKVLHHYRKRRPQAELAELAESRLVDLDPSPSAHYAKGREQRLLFEALRNLPLDHQIVLELYAWEGMTGPEVAAVLEISEAAMRSRLHRAKQELRRQLEALAESEALLQSTVSDLDGWARALRGLRQADEP